MRQPALKTLLEAAERILRQARQLPEYKQNIKAIDPEFNLLKATTNCVEIRERIGGQRGRS